MKNKVFFILISFALINLFFVSGCSRYNLNSIPSKPDNSTGQPKTYDNAGDNATVYSNITKTENKTIECYDSDNGTAYYTFGWVLDSEGNHTDECINYKMVKENICRNNSYYSFTYRCANACSNGACR